MAHIFFLAGEPSGDLYAGLVARALRQLDPEVRLCGVGGPELRQAGLEAVGDSSQLGVFGFTEGIEAGLRLRAFACSMRECLARIRPDCFVPVSFAGLNLGLASCARRLGIRVVYLSPPQVWAWGQWRAATLKRCADAIVCLLPFEPAELGRLGVKSVFLGNPLLDLATPVAEAPHFQGPGASRLVLLPGSRLAEIERHESLFREVALGLCRAIPNLQVRAIPFLKPGPVAAGPATDGPLSPVARYRLIAQADLALAVSGTVTLEAALLGVPMIVSYRLSPLNYLLARVAVRVKFFSLPNLIAGRQVVPEFIQPQSRELLACALELLQDSAARERMREDLMRVRQAMGEPGAARRIARMILEPPIDSD
ncbi:MAG: lipid-A-disaccharide synthase [candidate division WOR-3 bacterium]